MVTSRDTPTRDELRALTRGDQKMLRLLEKLFERASSTEQSFEEIEDVTDLWNNASLEIDADFQLPSILAGAALVLIGGSVVQRVKNTSGVAISKGKGVMLTGASGGLPSAALAVADGTNTEMIGIAGEDIAAAAEGFVVRRGIITDLDTSSFTAGDVLYFDASTPGDLTDTRPAAPNMRIGQAVVLTSHATDGIVLVHGRDHMTFDDLNAYLPSISDGDWLKWDAGNSRWIVGTGYSGDLTVTEGTITVVNGIVTTLT